MQPCICDVCECMLLLRDRYLNHLKVYHSNQKQDIFANLAHRPPNNTYVVVFFLQQSFQVIIWTEKDHCGTGEGCMPYEFNQLYQVYRFYL